MLAHRLIERKRDGGKLDAGEWRALIMAYAVSDRRPGLAYG